MLSNVSLWLFKQNKVAVYLVVIYEGDRFSNG